MKKIFVIILTLCIGFGLYAQKNKSQISITENVAGKNLIDTTNIRCLEYHFNESIFDYFLDRTL
jgi:hypothetical protein